MRAIKTFLILSHRYIGIPLSFFFVMWFVSGYFMIYTGGMPKVSPDMQVDGEEAIDFTKVVVTPEQAMKAANALRAELEAAGWLVEDSAGGTRIRRR